MLQFCAVPIWILQHGRLLREFLRTERRWLLRWGKLLYKRTILRAADWCGVVLPSLRRQRLLLLRLPSAGVRDGTYLQYQHEYLQLTRLLD